MADENRKSKPLGLMISVSKLEKNQIYKAWQNAAMKAMEARNDSRAARKKLSDFLRSHIPDLKKSGEK